MTQASGVVESCMKFIGNIFIHSFVRYLFSPHFIVGSTHIKASMAGKTWFLSLWDLQFWRRIQVNTQKAAADYNSC